MSAAHRPEFDALAEQIKQIVGTRPIVFFINPGNWGDSLIREGAEQFFRHYGLAYHPVRFKDVMKGRVTLDQVIAATRHDDPVMVYNGNGAFSHHYETLGRVAELSQSFGTSIVLPSTFEAAIDRSRFAPDSHFFVRDRFESAQAMPDCMFCHDMAFFLNLTCAEPTKDEGYLMREDMEKPEGAEIPQGNVDISKGGRAHTPIDGFLEAIGQYRHIHTNRLHVGIAGALLGRQTTLSANNYFKIRAIYQSSVEPFFDHVRFT
jgi:exopolysaccharide biosynthesis predicted pyruvyltransferase EpsI